VVSDGVTSQRIQWIDAARGVAILLVVLHHAMQVASSSGYSSALWKEVSEAFATLRMPLFFTLSGLLAVNWMSKSWRELLTNKVATFVWLYLLWQAVTVSVRLLFPTGTLTGGTVVRQLVIAVSTPIIPQNSLWFLWALAIFFVLSRLIFQLAPAWLVLSVSAVLSALVFSWTIYIKNPGWSGALENYVFFALGLYGALLIRAFADRVTAIQALAVVAIWAAAVFLTDYRALLLNVPIRLLGVAAGVAIGVLLARSRVLRAAGSRTLVFFLPHYIILGMLGLIVVQVDLGANARMWLPVALFAITLAAAVALHALAHRLRADWFYRLPDPIRRSLVRQPEPQANLN